MEANEEPSPVLGETDEEPEEVKEHVQELEEIGVRIE